MSTGTPKRSERNPSPARPFQAGRATSESCSGWRGSTGLGTATPTPTSRSGPRPQRARHSSMSAAMSSRVPSGSVLTAWARSCQTSTFPRRSVSATPTWLEPRSTPTRPNASSWNWRTIGRRPPLDCPGPASTTSPVARSSETVSETVDRERSVRRAISAREIVRSDQMSRRRPRACGRRGPDVTIWRPATRPRCPRIDPPFVRLSYEVGPTRCGGVKPAPRRQISRP